MQFGRMSLPLSLDEVLGPRRYEGRTAISSTAGIDYVSTFHGEGSDRFGLAAGPLGSSFFRGDRLRG